jgi:hypothetical protein
MLLALKKSLRIFVLYLLLLFSTFGSLLFYWYLRVNKSKVNHKLKIKLWAAVSDGTHNSNTDMIYWKKKYYIIHASSPYHFGTRECKLILRESPDAKHWKIVKTFSVSPEDIRDPKFAVINETLFLYALINVDFNPEPYATIWTSSTNGKDWEDWQKVNNHEGWLFWRPKKHPHKKDSWYVPAYWWEHGKSILLKSTDGIHWDKVSTINKGLRNDETAIEFLTDGRIICTARLEGSADIFGDNSGATLITIAKEPYTNWKSVTSSLTRLDGPVLFSQEGNVYAIGRFQPKLGLVTKQGAVLSRKRTSIFLVQEDKLTWLSDLPSAGDTSYAGITIKDNYLYVCYYTNNIKKDYPWLIGMISESDIIVCEIKLSNLKDITPN